MENLFCLICLSINDLFAEQFSSDFRFIFLDLEIVKLPGWDSPTFVIERNWH